MRSIKLLFIFWLVGFPLHSEPTAFFTHYNELDGLTEMNILSMMQDHKGKMWFGTYDGLNMFDGYKFKNFKNNPTYNGGLEDFRIDKIYEDKKGFIWLKNYGGRIYRFDPRTEIFLEIPQDIENYENYTPKFENIYIGKDGRIWLYGGNDGCFCVDENLSTQLNLIHYNESNGTLNSNEINNIYQDNTGNVWFLTSNGIGVKKRNMKMPLQYFKDTKLSKYYSIVEDASNIWIGGNDGVIRIYNKKNDSFDLIKIASSAQVIDLKKISPNQVFILTRHHGFYVYNLNDKSIIAFDKPGKSGLISTDFLSCYMDRSSNMWLESDKQGVVYYIANQNRIVNLNVSVATVAQLVPQKFFVLEDKYNNIWIHPRFGGFSLYNKTVGKLQTITEFQNSTDYKFSTALHTGFCDKQGNLWLSSLSKGIEKVVFSQSKFTFHIIDKNNISSVANEVRAVYQDKQKRIWVGTKDGKMTIYDQNFNQLGKLCIDGSIGNKNLFNGVVYTITEDSKSNIWLGTKGDGLYKLEKSVNKLRYKITNYKHESDNVYSISDNNIYHY